MSARRKHEPSILIEQYMAARIAQPGLNLKDWCAQQGKSYPTIRRLIGPHVVAAWDRVAARARAEAEKRLGGKLGERIAKMMGDSEKLFKQSLALMLPQEGKPATFLPTTQEEARRSLETAHRAMVQSAALLSGREPLLLDQGGEIEATEYDWAKPRARTAGKPRKPAKGKPAE